MTESPPDREIRASAYGLELPAMSEVWGAGNPPSEAEIELSKAISLKRIADALSWADGEIINNWAQTIAWNAGRSFESGRRQ